MTPQVRPAAPREYPLVRAMIARAFESCDEANLWEYLVQHHPGMRPEAVRVAVVDRCPVACAVVLLRRIRTRGGWTPGAVVTLVACDPPLQKRGLGGAVVRDALAHAAERGWALAMLYGDPRYYARFGFVPVLPSYRTTLALARLPGEGEDLRPAALEDLPTLHALYTAQLGGYPCAVERTAEPWEWRVRKPREYALLVLPGLQGYAFVAADRSGDVLVVREGAAVDLAAARRLLAALGREGRRRNLARICLCMPPDHPVVRIAVVGAGAEQTLQAAAAGMVAVTRWEPLLPPGYAVDERGLWHQGRLVLACGRPALAQMVMGYRTVDDLLLLPDVTLPGGDRDLQLLRRDFPARFPMWSVEPYWW